MSTSRTLALSCVVLAALSACAAVAQEPEQVAEVTVEGMRNADLKPYRTLWAALDAFDEHRSLAPKAELRGRFWRRNAVFGEQERWDGVTLRLAGNEHSLPVPVAVDGTFVLPRSQAAYDDDADLVLNQKKSTVGYDAQVRTPGLAPNVRRLGDLRLECEVKIAVAKKEIGFAQRAFFNTVFLGGDWCSSKRIKVAAFLGDWPLSAAIVDHGVRQPFRSDGYKLFAPVSDKSLSDDALIEFEFWSQASMERKQQFLATRPIALMTSADNWKEGAPFREQEKHRYSAVVDLKRGKWKFRLESGDGWLAFGGAPRDLVVSPGADLALKYHGERLVLDVDQPGVYAFSLDLRDPDHPRLAIRRAES